MYTYHVQVSYGVPASSSEAVNPQIPASDGGSNPSDNHQQQQLPPQPNRQRLLDPVHFSIIIFNLPVISEECW